MRIVAFAVALALGQVCAADQKPNVVFILADDLSYGDVGCYGHPYARTPNLDRLAAEGTMFKQFCAAGVTCCPTRTALMTGKLVATFKDYPATAGFGARPTVTELLKSAGYRTGHVGKWHIGPEAKAGVYGIDVVSADKEEGGPPRSERRDDPRGRDGVNFDAAIKFIEATDGRPFYLNIWTHTTHFPVDPPKPLVDRFADVKVNTADFQGYMRAYLEDHRKLGHDIDDAMRRYLAEVWSMDAQIGRLMRRLDELGLADNTIVVFSSDQGAVGESDMDAAPGKSTASKKRKKKPDPQGKRDTLFTVGYPGPFRGGKHTAYEGGVRVPFIVRWPGHVPAGKVNDKSVISGLDWLETLCAIAGVKIDATDFDGEDVSDILLGSDRLRVRPLFWREGNTSTRTTVVREGDWKLFASPRDELELYNIAMDPGEHDNVAAQHADVAGRLKADLDAWKKTLPTPSRS